jgi:hypothetical protein
MMLGGGGVRGTGIIVRGQAQVSSSLKPDVVRLTRMISPGIEVLRGVGSHGHDRRTNVGRYGWGNGCPISVFKKNNEERVDRAQPRLIRGGPYEQYQHHYE